MSDWLTGWLLDSYGRPSRSARRASAAAIAAAFVLAFLIASSSPTPEAQPRSGAEPALRASPSRDGLATSARLRRVAPLPDLRPDPPARAASTSAATTAAPAPVAAEPVNAAAPAPTATPPAPALSDPAPPPSQGERRGTPQPEPSFDSSGEFDSSG